MKLTSDQKDQIQTMIEDKSWDTVLQVCQLAVARQASLLSTVDMKEGANEVFARRAKLEGARDMHKLFMNIRQELKG